MDGGRKAKKMSQRRRRRRQRHHEKVVLQKNARKYFQSLASRERARARAHPLDSKLFTMHEHMYYQFCSHGMGALFIARSCYKSIYSHDSDVYS